MLYDCLYRNALVRTDLYMLVQRIQHNRHGLARLHVSCGEILGLIARLRVEDLRRTPAGELFRCLTERLNCVCSIIR